jgi:CRP-like cAMP-binding protein
MDKWDFKSQSILAGLPEEEVTLLEAHQSEQVYSKGEVIFREGAYPSGIFYIKK